LAIARSGPAGFGLRRTLVDVNGVMKAELARGEHKSLQTDRVILMPGPDDEVRIVNDKYRWFVDEGQRHRAAGHCGFALSQDKRCERPSQPGARGRHGFLEIEGRR
jgi:hypothetical protein